MSGGISLEAVDDDRVTPFQIEGEAVRGRLVRLGPAVAAIWHRPGALGNRAYKRKRPAKPCG